MGSESFRRLTSARVRLVRQSDGEILNGWMVQMTANRLRVTLREPEAGMVGEDYLVEVHGPSVRLVLNVKLLHASKNLAEFEVGRDIKFMPVSEPARIAVDNFAVICRCRTQEVVGRVANISREGLCIELPGEVLVGSFVDLEVRSGDDTYLVQGTIRYCVDNGDGLGVNRLGVQLSDPPAEWIGIFDKVSEAA